MPSRKMQSRRSVSIRSCITKKTTHCLTEKDLLKRKAVIYAFFDAKPEFDFDSKGAVEYLSWRCTHCGKKIWQGTKMKDKGSTGQLNFEPS